MNKGFTKIAAALFAAGISFNLYAANITVALDADPESLDVYEQLSGGILQFAHMSYDPLVRLTKDMKFEGRLAESWEQLEAALSSAWKQPGATLIELVVNDADGAQSLQSLLAQVSQL